MRGEAPVPSNGGLPLGTVDQDVCAKPNKSRARQIVGPQEPASELVTGSYSAAGHASGVQIKGGIFPWSVATMAVLALSAALLPRTAHADAPKLYDNHSVIGVTVETEAQLEALMQSDATVLDCVPGLGPMTVLATPKQLLELQSLDLAVEMLRDTVQPWMQTTQVAAVREDPFEDFFLDYHIYGDALTTGSIVWYMNELTKRYPHLASMVEIGTTLEGRTIWGIRISEDAIADKPGVLVFGGQHAREWISSTVPTYLATYLLENDGSDATVTDLLDRVEFFFIPVFNVDGYLFSGTTDRFWRKNRRRNHNGTFGVDLNRNWGEGWGGLGSSGVAGSDIYRGTFAFSEPETRALRDFFLAHPNIRAQLDLHSFGQLIMWPHGYTRALCPDHDTYFDIGQDMKSAIFEVHGRTYRPGRIFTRIYPAAGLSLDWTYAELDIMSYTIELRPAGGGLNQFDLSADHIIPNNEEVLPAILHLSGTDWIHGALRYRFSETLPSVIAPGSDTRLTVDIVGQREEIVPASVQMHFRFDPSGQFTATTMTQFEDDRYEAILPATNCTSAPEFYFSATGDGGTHRRSPPQSPAGGVYSAAITSGPMLIYSEKLDRDPQWSAEGRWQWGIPTGHGGREGGGPDPTRGRTNLFVYAYNLFGDYENDLPERHLTSPAIDCTGRIDVHVSFWRWLGVESPDRDRATVSVSKNAIDWVSVWENSEEMADTSWVFQEIDISSVADNQPTVYLRWTMGPSDASWRYCGWNIDDIEVTGRLCHSISGDHDGNGTVDLLDHAHVEACHSGPNGPVPPGCSVFDFDADGDVDCIDWLAFQSAWTDTVELPLHEVCDAFTAPAPDATARNRYLGFRAGGSLRQPQAFRVTTVSNPRYPETNGQRKWVGRPDIRGISRLECSPTYLDWRFGHIRLADEDILPGARYSIAATMNGMDFLEPIALETVPVWGDITGIFGEAGWTPPDGVVDMRDATAQIDAFQNLPSAPPMTWSDTAPAAPDGQITVLDIVYVVNAFGSGNYPFEAATGCR